MRYWFLIYLAVFIAFPGFVHADDRRLVLAYEEYPPFEYRDNGAPAGQNVEIVKRVCSRLGLEPVFVHEPFARMLFDAKSGEVDGLFSLLKRPDREGYLYYSDVPISFTTVGIVARHEFSGTIERLEDLRNYTVGAVRGYSHGSVVDALDGVDFYEVANNELLLKMLENGRIEIALCNLNVIRFFHNRIHPDEKLNVVKIIESDPLYIAFSKSTGERGRQLAEAFSRELTAMQEQ